MGGIRKHLSLKMKTLAEALGVLLAALDRLEVPYEIGGSVASSLHGIPRTTMGVDLVVDLSPEKIGQFVEEVRGEFYADAGQIREAFEAGRAATLIHLRSVWKFDLFPLRNDEYSRTEFGRRTFREIQPDSGSPMECAVSSMEDTILRKLEWFRAGGEISERQWSDILGMWNATGSRADMTYLRRWAEPLGVDDLLEKLTGS
jgi:hypothetical protein